MSGILLQISCTPHSTAGSALTTNRCTSLYFTLSHSSRVVLLLPLQIMHARVSDAFPEYNYSTELLIGKCIMTCTCALRKLVAAHLCVGWRAIAHIIVDTSIYSLLSLFCRASLRLDPHQEKGVFICFNTTGARLAVKQHIVNTHRKSIRIQSHMGLFLWQLKLSTV